MASRKEYETLFRLNAQLGGGFSSTFKSAQNELSAFQKEMQALNRTQSDVNAYQKQQSAVENTKKKLETLQQQYDNIQREIKETEGFSSDLQNKLLSKQQQIDKTSHSLEQQTDKLRQMDSALREAGVDTGNLKSESARLGSQMEELRKEQSQAAESAEDFGESSANAFSEIQQAIAAAGIAVALKEIYDGYMACVSAAGDFEESMSTVEALSGASSAELESLASMAKELGATTKFTAKESADAMTYMAMAGWDANDMLSGMDGVLQLAAASGEDLAMVSDIVTDNLSAFGLTAADTAHFSDVLAAAATSSNTNVSIMGETFKQSASVAGALGFSIEDVAVAVGLMANSGVKGSVAGTALKNTFNGLLEGVTLTGSAFGEYEYSALRVDGTMKDFGSTIDELREYFDQMTEAERVNNAMAIAGQRGYNGLLAILNATDKDYASLTKSINNCSGAASKMAAIKMDNMNGELTLAKSAWDALKMSIGEKFTPVMRKLYEIAAKVFGGLSTFIDRNPTLIKAIAAGAAVLGTVVTVLGALAAAAKIAAAASALLSSSIPGVNLIMGVTGAFAALTSALVILSDDGIPSVRELTEAAREMEETMEEAKSTYDDTVTSTLAAVNVAEDYIQELEQMEAAGISTDDQARQYHNTLVLLCRVVPELAEQIDLENDIIRGGTAALRDNTEAWAENAKRKAYQEYLNGLYEKYADVLIEAEENEIKLTDAKKAREDAENAHQDQLDRLSELWKQAQDAADAYLEATGEMLPAQNFLSEEYNQINMSLDEYGERLGSAIITEDAYNKAIKEDSDAIEAAKKEIALAEEAVKNLTGATDDGAESSENLAKQQQEVQSTISDMVSTLEELSKAYTEAYNAAYESVSGQYALWDKAAEVVATSAQTINSNLSSQIGYWQDYNANLASLGDRASDIEGLTDMLSSFADGSADSVNAVAGMAEASDEDLRMMVKNWQTLQEEQSKTADNLAVIKTGITEPTDEMLREYTAAIQDMDLSNEAKDSAASTIQSFIDAANEMLPQVREAYARLGNAALYALGRGTYGSSIVSVTGTSYGRPAYSTISANANGTTYADDIFIAGDDGPELIVGKKGASVFPAQETQRIIDAMPYGGYGGGAKITFAPVYQLEGVSNASDLETVLREHDEEFRAFIIQVVADSEADAARRRY